MPNWKQRLQSSLSLFAFSAIFVILLVLGISILSYAIIAFALIGIIVFIIAQINRWFGGKRSSTYTDQDGKQHRIIDQ